MIRNVLSTTAAVAALLLAAVPARADITVGFVTSLSGPASSIGILYGKGIAAALAYRSEVSGEKITLIQLDDGSDPSAATRDARKLVEENKVDILIGTSSAPSTIADDAGGGGIEGADDRHLAHHRPAGRDGGALGDLRAATAAVDDQGDYRPDGSRQDPDGRRISVSPMPGATWSITAPRRRRRPGEIKLTSDERYTRTDTSVTGQILKVLAARPRGCWMAVRPRRARCRCWRWPTVATRASCTEPRRW